MEGSTVSKQIAGRSFETIIAECLTKVDSPDYSNSGLNFQSAAEFSEDELHTLPITTRHLLIAENELLLNYDETAKELGQSRSSTEKKRLEHVYLRQEIQIQTIRDLFDSLIDIYLHDKKVSGWDETSLFVPVGTNWQFAMVDITALPRNQDDDSVECQPPGNRLH